MTRRTISGSRLSAAPSRNQPGNGSRERCDFPRRHGGDRRPGTLSSRDALQKTSGIRHHDVPRKS